MYDRNPYFGLGLIPKPKPKLADNLGPYCNRYRNEISKGKSNLQITPKMVFMRPIFSRIFYLKSNLKFVQKCKELPTLPTAEILSGKNARAWFSMNFT